MTTTVYFIIAGVGIATTLVGILAGLQAAGPSPKKTDPDKPKKMSWKTPPSSTPTGKPWAKPVIIIGSIIFIYGLLQAASSLMADSTPSYVRHAANKHEMLLERHAEHLGVILGELVPDANILAINLPPLQSEQALVDRQLAATKATLPTGVMISAAVAADWPIGVKPSLGRRMRSGLPSMWTADNLKETINQQPFPVGAIVTAMPLPADFPASKLWNDATLQWPAVILLDADPRGLETYLREKIVKAAIVSIPGFNPRALDEIPDDAAALWKQSKLIITIENLDETKEKHPTLFSKPSTPFNLKK